MVARLTLQRLCLANQLHLKMVMHRKANCRNLPPPLLTIRQIRPKTPMKGHRDPLFFYEDTGEEFLLRHPLSIATEILEVSVVFSNVCSVWNSDTISTTYPGNMLTAKAYACTLTLNLPPSNTKTYKAPAVYASKRAAINAIADYAMTCGILQEAARSMANSDRLSSSSYPIPTGMSSHRTFAETFSDTATNSVTLLNLAVQVSLYSLKTLPSQSRCLQCKLFLPLEILC